MSRIGKEPVAIPAGVTVTVDGQKVTVKGKLGELSYVMNDGITAKVEEGKIVIERKDDTIKNFHGLARALIHNNVVGKDNKSENSFSVSSRFLSKIYVREKDVISEVSSLTLTLSKNLLSKVRGKFKMPFSSLAVRL